MGTFMRAFGAMARQKALGGLCRWQAAGTTTHMLENGSWSVQLEQCSTVSVFYREPEPSFDGSNISSAKLSK